MKRVYKTTIILMIAICSNQPILAQSLRSIYFFDTNPTRHELNPAFATNKGYIGIPLLGNVGIGTQSNISLSSLIYPTKSGQLTTFLDRSISSETVLDKIESRNNLDGRFNMSVLSAGFHKWNGFNTIALNLKTTSRTSIPGDLFTMAKMGMDSPEGSFYNLGETRHTSDLYAEVAIGHSREIIRGLRIGAKAKILLGVASITANLNRLDASLTQDNWTINSNGTLEATGASFKIDETGRITGIKNFKPGVNGFGLAFDLGASYNITRNLNISASVLDLGFMKWNKNIQAQTSGTPFIFKGFNNISTSDRNSPNSFENQIDNLADDLKTLYSFYQSKTGTTSTRFLPTTLNVGVEHSFFNKKLAAGVLSTTGFSKEFIWTDVMLSAKYTPINWFSFGLNGSYSTLGWGYGALINFTTNGFNFFAGANTMTLRYTPQAVPIGRATLYGNIGFNVILNRNKIY